jgi:hypothetical protein
MNLLTPHQQKIQSGQNTVSKLENFHVEIKKWKNHADPKYGAIEMRELNWDINSLKPKPCKA